MRDAGRGETVRGHANEEKPELLFDVAAVLSTSVALGPVAEAFGVHEMSAFDTVQSSSDNIPAPLMLSEPLALSASLALSTNLALPTSIALPAGIALPTSIALPANRAIPTRYQEPAPLAVWDAPPLPFIGPEVAAGSTELVQGTPLLQQLSLLSVGGIEDFVRMHPESVANLLASPPATRDVTVWWQALDVQQRTTLSRATPQLVGNLDGIPFSARDFANRGVLDSTMADLEASIASATAGRTVIENARLQLTMLQSISSALGTSESQPHRTLMTLDVTGQGRAAIVVGDLTTADYVSYLVPGMFFTIENQMRDWADAAERLYEEQLSWLDLFSPRDAATPSDTGSDSSDSDSGSGSDSGSDQAETVATIAWIGYHTPNLTNVGGIDNAYEGRDALAGAIQGLQSLRSGDEPYVTVIAHSYGSTAALMALTEFDFEVDALALVGSPGSPAKSVDELHVRDGNVYVGEAAWDPIPNSSYFGSDPGSESYGARSMGVGGGVDVVTREPLLASNGHNEYFSAGTESMRNFALIGIGGGVLVTDASGQVAAKAVARSN